MSSIAEFETKEQIKEYLMRNDRQLYGSLVEKGPSNEKVIDKSEVQYLFDAPASSAATRNGNPSPDDQSETVASSSTCNNGSKSDEGKEDKNIGDLSIFNPSTNERTCKLCGESFKNTTHNTIFLRKCICCICRFEFNTPADVLAHCDSFKKQKKCCLCRTEIYDELSASGPIEEADPEVLKHIRACFNEKKKSEKLTQSKKSKK